MKTRTHAIEPGLPPLPEPTEPEPEPGIPPEPEPRPPSPNDPIPRQLRRRIDPRYAPPPPSVFTPTT